MRIISQNGLLDVPYELIAISPYSKNMATIIGTFPGNDLGKGDRVYILAEYSTEEKAVKAMEMCVENYADCNFSKELIPTLAKATIGMNLITDDDLEQIKATIGGRFFFRFPTDEEVRV